MRCCVNGTRRTICRSRRRRLPTAVTLRPGGGVKTDTNGRLRSIQEAPAPAAPTARGERCWLASTIWRHSIRSWRGSGTTGKMRRSFRRTSAPEVIDPSGSAAKKDTAGAQAFIPVLPGAAVRSAPGGRFSLERTTLRRWIRSWHRNGTRRATAN